MLNQALPTFMIMLREALEATLVVGIVLVTLQQSGQASLKRWVWFGVAAGVVVSAIMGGAAQALMGGFAGKAYFLSKAVFSLVAVGMLTWMLVWMTKQAKEMSGLVKAQVASATGKGGHAGLAVATIVAVAILREGAEISLFLAGTFKPTSAEGIARFAPMIGCIAGTAGAILIGLCIFSFGIRINLQLFFKSLGAMLLLIVAGLLVSALKDLDLANQTLFGYDPATKSNFLLAKPQLAVSWYSLGPEVLDIPKALGNPAWYQSLLYEGSPLEILLSAMFGYQAKWHLAQVLVWEMYMAAAGGAYFVALSNQGDKPKPPAVVPKPA